MTQDRPRDAGSPGALHALLDAALRPSPAAALGALAVAAALLATAALVGVPRLLERVPPARLMVDAGDRDVLLMHRTLRLHAAPTGDCVVALLGDSAVQFALSAEDALQAGLRERLRAAGSERTVDVRLLTTFGMTLWQKCAVTDAVAEKVTGALVISVEPDLVSWRLFDDRRANGLDRIALHSPAIDAEHRLAGAAPPERTGIAVLDHYDFLAPRLRAGMLGLLSAPIATDFHPGRPSRLQGEALKDNLLLVVQRMNARLNRAPGKHDGLGILERIITRFREHSDAPVVLLESPRHPLVRGALRYGKAPWFDLHVQTMQRFARRHGVHYLAPDVEAGLQASDFGDAYHVMEADARERFTRHLVERLAAILAGEAPR